MAISAQEPLQLQSRFRHVSEKLDTDESLLGFQLMGLEISEEGRGILRRIARIVGVYQRYKQISQSNMR